MIGPLEGNVERFRAKAILALVLVCGLAAYAMQVFVGIFIERDLAGAMSRLGVTYFVIPAFALGRGSGSGSSSGPSTRRRAKSPPAGSRARRIAKRRAQRPTRSRAS